MEFVGYQSFFVVFSRSVSFRTILAGSSNFPYIKPIITLEGSWDVNFDPKWGGPERITFDTLSDWSTRKKDGIKYYSGIATYHKTFDFTEPSDTGSKVFLDFGKVYEMARVILNGKDLGVVWCAPWQIEISEALKAGKNKLEIEVVNLWPNRLIGDAVLPHDKRLAWTIEDHPYKADSQLVPSGLMRPVTILIEE
jgi:hypothetical protein